MTTLLVAVVMLAIAGGLVWLLLRDRELGRQRDFERKVHARRQGWQYDGTREGTVEYRFAGETAGIAWQMHYDSDRGAETPTPRAIWHSSNLRTPQLSVLILGRARHRLESGVAGRLMIGVLTGVVQAVAGRTVDAASGKSAFYDNAVVLDWPGAASSPFVIAVGPDLPRDWIDESLLQLLTDWPSANAARFKPADCIEAALGAEGLRIEVRHMPQEIPCWLHLARLGEHLAQRLAASARRP